MSEKPFSCPVCNRGYVTTLGLERHLEAKHPDFVQMSEEDQRNLLTEIGPRFVEPEPETAEGLGEPVLASPVPVDPDLTAKLAVQNSQMLDMLVGKRGPDGRDEPGWMQSMERQIRALSEKMSTTREPGASIMGDLNKPENKWLQDIITNVSKGVQNWAMGGGSEREEAFMTLIGDEGRELILENLRAEKEMFADFKRAVRQGKVKFDTEP